MNAWRGHAGTSALFGIGPGLLPSMPQPTAAQKGADGVGVANSQSSAGAARPPSAQLLIFAASHFCLVAQLSASESRPRMFSARQST